MIRRSSPTIFLGLRLCLIVVGLSVVVLPLGLTTATHPGGSNRFFALGPPFHRFGAIDSLSNHSSSVGCIGTQSWSGEIGPWSEGDSKRYGGFGVGQVVHLQACSTPGSLNLTAHLGFRHIRFSVPSNGIYPVRAYWHYSYVSMVYVHLNSTGQPISFTAKARVYVVSHLTDLNGSFHGSCPINGGTVVTHNGTKWFNQTNVTNSCTIIGTRNTTLLAGHTYDFESWLVISLHTSDSGSLSGSVGEAFVDISPNWGYGARLVKVTV